MKVKKNFEYEGVKLRIVEREEPRYTNCSDLIKVTRVLSPNGKVIPIRMKHKQRLKDMVEETIKALDNFKDLGADVKAELLK